VALNGDGNTLIAGAPRRTVNGKPYAGAAEVFRFSNGSCSGTTQIGLGTQAIANGWFGGSVSLSADGNTAIVGDRNRVVHDKVGAGMVRVYRFSQGAWRAAAALGSGAKANKHDMLGFSDAVSADGNTVLAGALERSATVQHSGNAGGVSILSSSFQLPLSQASRRPGAPPGRGWFG
jgi:hypothetical protein